MRWSIWSGIHSPEYWEYEVVTRVEVMEGGYIKGLNGRMLLEG